MASARRMSGRRSSKPDGSPDGSCGTAVAASIDAPRAISGVNTARGERPVSVASADSRRPIDWRTRAMSATTAESSASAWRRSYSPMMPPSKRSRCSATVSVRDFFVSSSTAASASAARSLKYALATSAATVMRTVSR